MSKLTPRPRLEELTISSKRTRVNQQIRVPKVRLIDADGAQVGIVATDDAILKAQAASLDLVEISPNAEPPVCRIMDHGKYLFELRKRRQSAKRKQKVVQVKEVKFRPGTDIGDYNVKLRKIVSFLERGDRVKVALRFRGREMQHRELGLELLNRLKGDLPENLVVEQEPKLEGRQMTMGLSLGKVDKPKSKGQKDAKVED
ncbi:MAG: translation initiation factor IF-3 [Gammaproteobacteria bacterium]|nr:translation initiation factor IF-3 [Gammaproteobacteria bacterium]